MKSLIILIAVLAATSTVRAEPSRTFYDSRGSFAGTANTHGNTTSFSDRRGGFAGTSIRNNNGTTSIYDRNGHFVGSSVDRKR